MTRLVWPAVLLLFAACHSHPEKTEGVEYFYDCEDARRPAGLMVYATDEAYREFLDQVAAVGLKKDNTQSPQLMSPAADSTLSIATPPAFNFSTGMTLRTNEAVPNPRIPPRPRSRWARLKEALSPVGTAWAHCPTVTGTLYLVQLTAAGEKEPAYTALTSVNTFTPGAIWKEKLQPLSGKRVTLTLARGVFSMGHLELGPFVADREVGFTVGP